MESLQNVFTALVLALLPLQSVVFLFSAEKDQPMWTSYIASWGKTLCAIGVLFGVRTGPKEWNGPVAFTCLTLACAPGAILIIHILGRMVL